MQALSDTPHTRTIRRLAFNPDGRKLAASSFDATVTVWERGSDGGDRQDGAIRFTFPEICDQSFHSALLWKDTRMK